MQQESRNPAKKPHIHIWTDGSCIAKGKKSGNGGWGAIICIGDVEVELQAGYESTTNTRMELMAPIAALKALPQDSLCITIHSDSRYVVDSHNKGWLRAWADNGWRNQKKQPILNADLWVELAALEKGKNVRYEWVKGHVGKPLNERADTLAKQAARSQNKYYDAGCNRDWEEMFALSEVRETHEVRL